MGLSIRWKLFLFIGGLVTLVALAFGGAAYQAVRQSSLSATTQHLTSIAGQWARLFGDGTARQSAAFRAVAGHALIQEALARRGESALAAAETALRPLLPAGQVSSLRLLDRDRAPLLVLGDTATAVRAPVDPALLDAAAAQDSLAVGPIRAVGRAVVGSYARRITVDGAVAGYVTQTTQVKVTPSPDAINALFGGTATRVRIANRDGSVWTDLAEPVPAPSPPVVLSEGLLSYDTPAAGPAFASAVPIAGTPWMVVMETDKAQVLADSRRVLLRLLLVLAVRAPGSSGHHLSPTRMNSMDTANRLSALSGWRPRRSGSPASR